MIELTGERSATLVFEVEDPERAVALIEQARTGAVPAPPMVRQKVPEMLGS